MIGNRNHHQDCFYVNTSQKIAISKINSHVCRHSTIVVASMKYPLHILHVMNGFSGLSFIFRSIILKLYFRQHETSFLFSNYGYLHQVAVYYK